MKPSQVIYTLRKLRAVLAGEGDAQAAQALEIAAEALECAQDAERLERSVKKKAVPVARIRGPVVAGARRLGGIADHIAAKQWQQGK